MINRLLTRTAARYPHLDQRALKLALAAYPLLMLACALAIALLGSASQFHDALAGIALGTCGGLALMNLLWTLAERGAARNAARRQQ